MDTIHKMKTETRTRMMKWIRGLIQLDGGGVCQAEIEILSGLHITHLQTVLGHGFITLLMGRKSQEPANTPRTWRQGDEAIFHLPRYLEGTRYKPEAKMERIVDLKETVWNKNGLPSDCTAITETEKAINILGKYFGTREEARSRAKECTARIKTMTPEGPPLVIDVDDRNPGKGQLTRVGDETVMLMDTTKEAMEKGKPKWEPILYEGRPVPPVGSTRRMKKQKRVSANPAAEDSDAEDEENPRKKTTIVRGSPPATTSGISTRKESQATTSSQASASERDTDSSMVGELKKKIEELTRQLENKQILGVSNTETNFSDMEFIVSTAEQSQEESEETPMVLDRPDTYAMMLEETEGVVPDEYGNTNTCMMGRKEPRSFELVTGSDAESDAESVQDEGSDYFDSDAEELAPEHRGQVRYVHLGRQMTKEDHAAKAPAFIKELLEYFNGKLHALKLTCRTEGEGWKMDVRDVEDHIRDYPYPRYCARCDTVLPDSLDNCTCGKYDPRSGHAYLRCEPYQRARLYRSMMTNPKTLSYAMERALTFANTKSYEDIIEGRPLIGLDCEMWKVLTKNGNPVVKATINKEFRRHFVESHPDMDENKFRSWPMVVEVGANVLYPDGSEEVIMDERFRIPSTWLEPQLIHPASYSIKKDAVKYLDWLIETSETREEKRILEKEKAKFLNCFYGLARFPGGVKYTLYKFLREAYAYLDEGKGSYQESYWITQIPEEKRSDFVSLVRTKPVKHGGGLCAYSVTRANLRCCFDARNVLDAILKQLPPGVILVYSGENDFDCLSYYPGGGHVIVDVTWIPAFRYMILCREEWEREGMNMAVHPEHLFKLRQVQLMKLSLAWIAFTDPTEEEAAAAIEGAHSAATDAKMTRELFLVVMKFREKNAAMFDMLAPVEMDRRFYARLMAAAFDMETEGPVGLVKKGVRAKRLRQVLRTNNLHAEVCGHLPYGQEG